MHNGAPAHFSNAVRNHLHATYFLRFIGLGGPVAWSSSFPYLNPLDFCFWDCLKSVVYESDGGYSSGYSGGTDRRRFRWHRQHTRYVLMRR
ncbi:hypothetical protein TNCV_2166221 [Trichonephila clavipes]|nr:hypothetical protein TNCV_2166221 [Trichonephila clavipes]